MKILATVSIKGGVGKTATALNLAGALHIQGKSVAVVDGNLATADIASFLQVSGLSSTLLHVIHLNTHIKDACYQHASGLRMVLGQPSMQHDADALSILRMKLMGLDAELTILDSGSGRDCISGIEAADDVIVVSTTDPGSLQYALRTIHAAEEKGKTVLGAVLTRTTGKENINAIEAYLHTQVIGNIPYDEKLFHALHEPLVMAEPSSRSSKAYHALGRYIRGLYGN